MFSGCGSRLNWPFLLKSCWVRLGCHHQGPSSLADTFLLSSYLAQSRFEVNFRRVDPQCPQLWACYLPARNLSDVCCRDVDRCFDWYHRWTDFGRHLATVLISPFVYKLKLTVKILRWLFLSDHCLPISFLSITLFRAVLFSKLVIASESTLIPSHMPWPVFALHP